jgi:hypothetical protein
MIDKYFLIPAGQKVWSIALQETIIFERDVVAQVTNTVYGSDDYIYGIVQERLWSDSSLLNKKHGDIGFSLKGTTEFNETRCTYHQWQTIH